MIGWSDRALVLRRNRLGENHVVLDAFCEHQGRARGVVHGGAGRRRGPALEPGNCLDLEWRARTSAQLGHFAGVELVDARAAALYDDPLGLAAMSGALALLSSFLSEGLAKPELFASTRLLFGALGDRDVMPAVFVRWELGLLAVCGYALDLRRCAVTGSREDLAWVSPKSGRAVGADAAGPWVDRLFRLPRFLVDNRAPATPSDIDAGLALTGHFLCKGAAAERQADLPAARRRFVEQLRSRGLAASAAAA